MKWLWWAPLFAVLAHILEEFVYPGGFPEWDRSYRPSIRSSITPRFHLAVNAALVLACVSVGTAGAKEGVLRLGALRFRSIVPPSYAVAAWLALAALLFSNSVFHVVGTLQTGRMSPGTRTSLLLYVPMAAYGYWYFLTRDETTILTAIVSALLGGSYHLWSSLLHAFRARPDLHAKSNPPD